MVRQRLSDLLSHVLIFIGCAETARQKILSILHHTTNSHTFPSFTHFSKCEHGEKDEEKRPWIPAGSLAMAKLRKAICGEDNKNLDDLNHMTGEESINGLDNSYSPIDISEFVHTGDIESINNLQLKYANKTFSYR